LDEETRKLGRYELLEEVGTGGMARVFRAVRAGPMGFRKEVALKQILPHVPREEKLVQALINEARVGGYLRHRNLVEIYEFEHIDDHYVLSMEFVDGHTLHRILRQGRQRGPLPLWVIADIAIQVCEGLEYAHAAVDEQGKQLRLVHRDLKPGNVMITRAGQVKIMDFGIAKSQVNLFQTTTASITKGTPVYMSPEQVDGLPLDHRSDLFSLGSVIAEMITGEVVFECTQLFHVLGRIARADTAGTLMRVEGRWPEMAPILDRALRRDPMDRYPDAGALRAALEEIRRGVVGGDGLTAWVADWMGEGAGAGDSGEATPNLAGAVDAAQLTLRPPAGEGGGAAESSDFSPVDRTLDYLPAAADDDAAGPPSLTTTPTPPGPAPVAERGSAVPTGRGLSQLATDDELRRPNPWRAAALLGVGLAGLALVTGGGWALWRAGQGGGIADEPGPAGEPTPAPGATKEIFSPEDIARWQGTVIAAHGLEMVPIPAGSFEMGSPGDEAGRAGDETQHGVSLSRSFLLGRTEVSRGLWAEVLGKRAPSRRERNLPVTRVTWAEAADFCNRLSRLEGLATAYSGRGAFVEPRDGATGYRLPTEAEWEYAARADTHSRYAGTDRDAEICQYANVADATALAASPALTPFDCDDGHAELAPVGSFQPNALGLHDLTGNATEWVWDRYAEELGSVPVTDPTGPDDGRDRVSRGGAYFSVPSFVRLAHRTHAAPDAKSDVRGFRVARTIP
jgi:formylglycine-generating enzyme required for sulfatase activity